MKKIVFSLMLCGLFGVAKSANPIATDVFTADPAPLVYKNRLYAFVGHDTAHVGANTYQMPDWLVYSTKDMATWTSHGPRLAVTDFKWAAKAANAAHCIERNGKFYWYISIIHRSDANSKGGVGIGVAVADNPLGPYKDALGKALITNEMTTDQTHSWDDLDPAVFIDDNNQAYMFWGNGSCKWVKLKSNMIELDGPITAFKPKNFTEAPWIYKRKGLYYLIYAANFPETIEYCTSTSIEGPWTYRGVIQDPTPNSTTTHPGVVDFKGKTYFFYHHGALPTGGSYRRAVCVETLNFNADGSIQKVVLTQTGPKRIKKKFLLF